MFSSFDDHKMVERVLFKGPCSAELKTLGTFFHIIIDKDITPSISSISSLSIEYLHATVPLLRRIVRPVGDGKTRRSFWIR